MTEKDYYAALTRHFEKKALHLQRSIVWDAKFTRTNSIAFSCLAPHQEEKMLKAERAYGYKIPDAGLGQKPFDGLAVYDALAILAIVYYKPRKTVIYEIFVADFIRERESGGRKSLTKERADEIALSTIVLAKGS